MPIPLPAPAQTLGTIILWLARAADAPRTGVRLAAPLLMLLMNRIREINQRFARIAARVAAGTYAPRRPARRSRSASRRRPTPTSAPRQFGWVTRLLPEALAFGTQLECLFREPEMAALMAAAAPSLRRPLRSLCHMLGVQPPPVLALPPRKPPQPAAAAAIPPALLTGHAATPPQPPTRPPPACGKLTAHSA